MINIIAGFVAWFTNNKGLSLIDLSEYSILMTSRLIVTWVVSLLFLGIGLSHMQALGAIAITVGIIVAFYTKKTFKKQCKQVFCGGVIFQKTCKNMKQ